MSARKRSGSPMLSSDSRLLKHTASSMPKTGRSSGIVRVPVGGMSPSGSFIAELPATAASTIAGSDTQSAPNSPRRTQSMHRTYHESQVGSCIRHDNPPRVSSVTSRRLASSPNTSVLQGVPRTESQASMGSEVVLDRASPLHRRAFNHTSGLVFPTPETAHSPQRLWLSKPLADGSCVANLKKMFPGRSGSPISAAAFKPAAPEVSGPHSRAASSRRGRSGSPSGKRFIPAANHISGCSMTVSVDNEPKHRGRRPDAEHTGQRHAPYYEPLVDDAPTAQWRGLHGYGATGKSHASRPPDNTRLFDTPTNSEGSEKLARGVKQFPISHKSLRVYALTEHPAEEVNEQQHRPARVVRHGAPPFIPAPLPVRSTQSPRRGAQANAGSDIFNRTVAQTTATPLRVGRGVGAYSPVRRTERPF